MKKEIIGEDPQVVIKAPGYDTYLISKESCNELKVKVYRRKQHGNLNSDC